MKAIAYVTNIETGVPDAPNDIVGDEAVDMPDVIALPAMDRHTRRMPQHVIERTRFGLQRNEEMQHAAWFQHASRLTQEATKIGYMLQQVEKDDGRKAVVAIGQDARIECDIFGCRISLPRFLQ